MRQRYQRWQHQTTPAVLAEPGISPPHVGRGLCTHERAACRADVLLVWHPWLFHHHAPPEAQRVPDEPGFLNLAAPHATDDDPCHGQWLASRAAAEQSALMCAACRPADHHLVLFGDL